MTVVYKLATDVYDINPIDDLDRLLRRHDRFKPILDFGLKIDLSIAYSDKAHAVKSHGAPALAKIKIIGPEDRARGNGDVRITIDGRKYLKRTQRRREAILCHELYHIRIKTHQAIEKDADGRERQVMKPDLDPYGRPVVKLIPDDWEINGFREVAEWYGDDSAEVIHVRAVSKVLDQLVLPFVQAPVVPEPDQADVIVPDLETVLAAESEADKASWDVPTIGTVVYKKTFDRALSDDEMTVTARDAIAFLAKPVSALAKYGLSEEVIDELEKTGFYTLGALIQRIEDGELAEYAPSISDEEVDQVVTAVRKARMGAPTEEAESEPEPVKPKKPRVNKKAVRAEAVKARAAELLVSKTGGNFPDGPTIAAVKPPELGLFTIHPNGGKNPLLTTALRAPSLMAATYWAKAHHRSAKVKPDDGMVARLGIKVIEVDSRGTEVTPAPIRVCNRCNTERPGSVGVCPKCSSPEFRLKGDVDPLAPATKPRKRSAAKTKPIVRGVAS